MTDMRVVDFDALPGAIVAVLDANRWSLTTTLTQAEQVVRALRMVSQPTQRQEQVDESSSVSALVDAVGDLIESRTDMRYNERYVTDWRRK